MYWMANYGHLHTTPRAHFKSPTEGSMVWGLAWHPEGHLLVSTGNDHKLRFWARQKPTDDVPKEVPPPLTMQQHYNS